MTIVDPEFAAEHAALIGVRYEQYVQALQALQGFEPCTSPWPVDPPYPGYRGTVCDLLEGHTAYEKPHRHRIGGSQVVVEW